MARRAQERVSITRASFRAFNVKVSALDQVWCVISVSLSLRIKNWFLFYYLSFYFLSLLVVMDK
jgi:hypothetical protein